jgi:hypothetical protein
MSYLEQVAKVLADQLERFVTLNRHQLAGQAANLDFWLGETRHALDVVGGYHERFRRLKEAQTNYVNDHCTIQFDVRAPYPDDVDLTPDPPRRILDANLRDSRRAVSDALYRFLVRLFHDGFIPEQRLRAICTELDIGIDVMDLRRKRG